MVKLLGFLGTCYELEPDPNNIAKTTLKTIFEIFSLLITLIALFSYQSVKSSPADFGQSISVGNVRIDGVTCLRHDGKC